MGLLHDPARPAEAAFCRRGQAEPRYRRPVLRVRRNRPYRGAADGFTAGLRRRFGENIQPGTEPGVT